jgi:hypothetical protein
MLLKLIIASLFFAYLAVQTCGNQAVKVKNAPTSNCPYNLSAPSTTLNLEASLREISGLTATGNDAQLGCLQDESGQLFYIDKQTGKATPSVIFQNSGDFEGIEFVNDTLWATTSKGKLYKIWNLDKTPFDSEIIKIESLKKANIEGLGYDKLNHRLLLAAKGDKADGASLRTIWAFDLQNQASSPIESGFRNSTVTKAFDIQLTDFQEFLKNKTEPAYTKLTKDYIEAPSATGFEFGPSGIAVHPLNGHISCRRSIKYC